MEITVTAALAALKAAHETAKQMLKFVEKLKNRELRELVDKEMSDLSNLRMALDDMAQKNTELWAELTALKAKLQAREEFDYDADRNAMCKVREGKPVGGPHCPKCYADKGKPAPMAKKAEGRHQCVLCGYWDNDPPMAGGFQVVPITYGDR